MRSHLRIRQGRRKVSLPPNLGLSRQYLQVPQSVRMQAAHSPQRPAAFFFVGFFFFLGTPGLPDFLDFFLAGLRALRDGAGSGRDEAGWAGRGEAASRHARGRSGCKQCVGAWLREWQSECVRAARTCVRVCVHERI